METPAGQTANNTLVEVASCTGADNQHWTHAGSGLRNLASGRCLDLNYGNQTNGEQLQVYDCVGNGNQQWSLPASGAGWTAAWGSAMQESWALDGGSDFTCRDIARVTLSGTAVRIRLSNMGDDTSVSFNAVSVAERDVGGSVVSGTSHTLTFDGATTVTIPPNGEVISDGVGMDVTQGEDLAVSTYIAGSADTYPNHLYGQITHYCTDLHSGGNHVSDVSDAAFTGISSNVAWLTEIDVAGGTGAVALLGDSITDGTSAGLDQFNRWPDDLATRLQDAHDDVGVLNEGIGGNGVVQSYADDGDPAVARFGRDVLAPTNVTTVLLLIGSNDIGQDIDADTIINGLTDIADRAHAAGLRVIGGTVLPRWCGWFNLGNSESEESVRQQVNQFIRTNSVFDAVVDFDAAMRNTDPNYRPLKTADGQQDCPLPDNDQEYLAQAYDSGDHTHPSVAGYAAMANAVDLSAVLGRTGSPTGEIVWNSSTSCADRDVASGRIQIWGCLAGPNQLWTLNPDGTLTTGGVCMEEPVGQTSNMTPVDAAPCTGQANQRWSVDASQRLVNAESGRCLDLPGGDTVDHPQLQIYDCLPADGNQLWGGAA